MPTLVIRLLGRPEIERDGAPAARSASPTRCADALVSVEGENMRGVTWCVIDEVKSGDWAIGGQCLTTEVVHTGRRATRLTTSGVAGRGSTAHRPLRWQRLR